MAYLETTSIDDLHEILAAVDGKKPTQRVLAGIAYKDGVTQQTIARRHDVHPNTVRNWLQRLDRLDDEPVDAVLADAPRPGQSRELTDSEYDQFVDAVNSPPSDADRDAPAWTVSLAREYLQETVDVEYCRRHVRRLLSEAGLVPRPARPEYVEAGDRSTKTLQQALENRRTIWTATTTQ